MLHALTIFRNFIGKSDVDSNWIFCTTAIRYFVCLSAGHSLVPIQRQSYFSNPGNAGQFNGDVRFVANYRDQWRSVTVPFQT